IGIVARNDAGLRPLRRPSFPAPDVEHNDVAWSGLDSGFFLPGFKIGAGDRGPWLDPIDALQLRDVIENATCDDAVLPGPDAVLLASGLGRDVVGHLVAVVHRSVGEEMTEGIHMRQAQTVVTNLIVVGR